MNKLLLFVCIFAFSLYTLAQKIEERLSDEKLLRFVANKYNQDGVDRYTDWLTLLKKHQSDNAWVQLNAVNSFFNRHVDYYEDIAFWGKKDYWASPIETLGRGGGDCEDYAIAKYFSLLALGVPENKLRLMYVRQLTLNVPHMVLIYFEEENATPLVLDNFKRKVLPATKRPDLKPIYSFNGYGLWLSKAKGIGSKVRNQHGLKSWQSMIDRIEEDLSANNGVDNID
ncbi:transglutaminase-like cysteine peptidase [Pseudoalteromonas sp. KS88]|uniref:transglutaminase-like cysteine peptidase n=1 Tax=Pseudoalteromonas sp. KS88 TaxID=2109918 RepID=UPI001FD97E65|nr:transglutaminase-like cysteine peptidase [Pseudoalteromonas sp. KS88]